MLDRRLRCSRRKFLAQATGLALAGGVAPTAVRGAELAGFKKPRQIAVVAELPKTATGKIDKKALRVFVAQSSPAAVRA